jgi:acyl dehydratase
MTLAASSAFPGQTFSAVVVDELTRTQIVQYAGASGDYNPLHTDEVYATRVAGYPTVFAHGMLTMGATAKLLTDVGGDGRLVRYGVRFVKQVWPGDTLTATATITEVRTDDREADLDIVTTNQLGDAVLTGSATVRLDP